MDVTLRVRCGVCNKEVVSVIQSRDVVTQSDFELPTSVPKQDCLKN